MPLGWASPSSSEHSTTKQPFHIPGNPCETASVNSGDLAEAAIFGLMPISEAGLRGMDIERRCP
jgi:hypothetical protein